MAEKIADNMTEKRTGNMTGMIIEKKPVLGTAAIIRKDGKILIAQRNKDSKLEADKWEFPGGKVEFLEDPKDTIVREIKEELDLVIRPLKEFGIISARFDKAGEQFHVVLIFYECEYISGEIRLLDCQDARWVFAEELNQYDFAKADIAIVKKIMGL